MISNWLQWFKSHCLPATKHDLKEMEKRIMIELDNLTTEVTDIETVIDSAITTIATLSDLVKAAGTDPVKLKELIDSLDTKKVALANAIASVPPTTITPAA